MQNKTKTSTWRLLLLTTKSGSCMRFRMISYRTGRRSDLNLTGIHCPISQTTLLRINLYLWWRDRDWFSWLLVQIIIVPLLLKWNHFLWCRETFLVVQHLVNGLCNTRPSMIKVLTLLLYTFSIWPHISKHIHTQTRAFTEGKKTQFPTKCHLL